MEVTYGYDMKGGETFVSPMQRASDIVLSVGTPELFALCTAFPFGGFVVPCIPSIILTCVQCSEGASVVVSRDGMEV